MAINAAATIAVIVAIDKVTAEQGILTTFEKTVKGRARKYTNTTLCYPSSPMLHFVNTLRNEEHDSTLTI